MPVFLVEIHFNIKQQDNISFLRLLESFSGVDVNDMAC